jgi:hypothetical protein
VEPASDKVTAAVYGVMKSDPFVRALYVEYAEIANRFRTLRHLVSELPSREIRPDGTPPIADDPDYTEAKTWFGFLDRLMLDADATYEPPSRDASTGVITTRARQAARRLQA